MDENVRLPDLWADPELASLVRAAAARRGVSYAEFARTALKLLVWFQNEVESTGARAPRDDARWCVVCGMPRRPGTVEFEALEHAQCDQVLANMERELVS